MSRWSVHVTTMMQVVLLLFKDQTQGRRTESTSAKAKSQTWDETLSVRAGFSPEARSYRCLA